MHRDYTYFLKKNRKKRRKKNEIISCSKPNKFVRKRSMRKLDQTICTEQAFLPSPPPLPLGSALKLNLRSFTINFLSTMDKGEGEGG